MITVIHRGDAPEVLAALRHFKIVHAEHDLRRPDISENELWIVGGHLSDVGRCKRNEDGSLERMTPTIIISNGLGTTVLADDRPDPLLVKLLPLGNGWTSDSHIRQPDGRCSCKINPVSRMLKAATTYNGTPDAKPTGPYMHVQEIPERKLTAITPAMIQHHEEVVKTLKPGEYHGFSGDGTCTCTSDIEKRG